MYEASSHSLFVAGCCFGRSDRLLSCSWYAACPATTEDRFSRVGVDMGTLRDGTAICVCVLLAHADATTDAPTCVDAALHAGFHIEHSHSYDLHELQRLICSGGYGFAASFGVRAAPLSPAAEVRDAMALFVRAAPSNERRA